MDHYRTWLSGLKHALTDANEETLVAAINVSSDTLSRLPENLCSTTFIGQPDTLDTLSKLKTAIGGPSAAKLKEDLDTRIRKWEESKNVPLPFRSHHLSTPSPAPPSESSYSSRGSIPLQYTVGNARLQNFQIPVEMPPTTSERHPTKRSRKGSSNLGLSSNFLAGEIPNAYKTVQEDDLTRILDGQQHLAAQLQELTTHVKRNTHSYQEHEKQFTQKIAQDTEWKVEVDQKLQSILDFLYHSLPVPGHPTDIPPAPTSDQSQNFGQPNFGPPPNLPQSTFLPPLNFGPAHPNFGPTHPSFGPAHPNFGPTHPSFGPAHPNVGPPHSNAAGPTYSNTAGPAYSNTAGPSHSNLGPPPLTYSHTGFQSPQTQPLLAYNQSSYSPGTRKSS